jgi:hypothetical protein
MSWPDGYRHGSSFSSDPGSEIVSACYRFQTLIRGRDRCSGNWGVRDCRLAGSLDTRTLPQDQRTSTGGLNAIALLATSLLALGVLAPSGSMSFAATATVPRPDHIVIVIDENHSESDVVGRSAAPYINSLAAKRRRASRFSSVLRSLIEARAAWPEW